MKRRGKKKGKRRRKSLAGGLARRYAGNPIALTTNH